ncbi:hypothetical protein Hdeb2414_s0004g00142201 [Helianthus debilis subsp. tardiflorus]
MLVSKGRLAFGVLRLMQISVGLMLYNESSPCITFWHFALNIISNRLFGEVEEDAEHLLVSCYFQL